ncbi:hypothetical protein TNCV_2523511 [Trichonephila clavipes]|nr:hypothetical protein TNCV_2523511 [Trichonephila clavipes]
MDNRNEPTDMDLIDSPRRTPTPPPLSASPGAANRSQSSLYPTSNLREQSLSSQPSQKTQKLSTQMKNHSHASRIPLPDQSPSCHPAEWKTPLLPCPASQTLTIWD